MSEYLWNFWIAVSQLLNTIIGGSPDETVCARAWRHSLEGHKLSIYFVKTLNAIFFLQENHCKDAWESEVQMRQTSKEVRDAVKSQ
jgi:hypothetical protein